MARRRSPVAVEITEGAIRVASRGRSLTLTAVAPLPDAQERTDFLIRLDDIEFWDAPHDTEEIAIEDLQRVLDAIEEECEGHGLSVAFE